MKFPVAMLVGGTLAIGGCSDSSNGGPGSPDAGPVDPGNLSLTWLPLTADAQGNGVATPCPSGVTTAVVYVLPEGQTDNPTEHLALCDDRQIVIRDIAAGRYQVWMRLTDSQRVTRYAESTTRLTDIIVGETATQDFPIFVDHGFFQLSWNLRPPGSVGPVSCASITGQGGVAITVSDTGGGVFETVLDCEEGLAPNFVLTRPIPAGSSVTASPAYSIVVTLLDNTASEIACSATLSTNDVGSLDYGNKVLDAGFIEIDQN